LVRRPKVKKPVVASAGHAGGVEGALPMPADRE
jgi:hypothetical protein